ncbi:hypothetical protein [Roseibium sp. MMSF_3544]|uniref:hypothetical protein n=1 Tax=Roseibium sp. MMSF_3544 TaxID=3046723 RepID=UPI00273F31A3|nr:hypothetical protein [Roseibium sp. MMSF_3544]
MADYYSILKKTIASLPESNGAARRSVYSRARNAIVNQLKAYEPPLSPSEITAEQLRLEEAIRKVEAEAARESLGLSPAASTSAPDVEPPEPEVTEPPAVEEPQVEPPPPPPVAEETLPEETPEPTAASEVQETVEDVPSPLKETLSEAESLGVAANQAVQNAKEVVEPDKAASSPPPVPEPRQEPVFDSAASPSDEEIFEHKPVEDGKAVPPIQPDGSEKSAPAKGRARRDRPSASEALRSSSSSNRIVPIALTVVALIALLAAGGYFFLPIGDQLALTSQQSDGAVSQGTQDTSTAAVSGSQTDDTESSKNTDRLLSGETEDVIAPDARAVTTTTINPQSDDAVPAPSQPAIVASTGGETPQVETVVPDTGANTAPADGSEAPLAVPEDNLAAIAPDEAAPEDPSVGVASSASGAQRSILYEEGEDAGGSGTASQGAVVWGVEETNNLDGQQLSVLTASVDIPERDVKVNIRIKPNDDTSLPASHLVEIIYEFPENFAAGDVVNVPGLVMKPTEEARGDALIGASVKVSPGYFWIALSSLPNEQQRNLALLRERGWIDIPMLYENGKRGILTLEKGSVGADAVEQAVSTWQAG